MRLASWARELPASPGDSRMQQPRNPAMNCSSSDDKPSRKRRARVFRGLSTHETRAATRLLRTADLLSVRNHTNFLGGSGRIMAKTAPRCKGVDRQGTPLLGLGYNRSTPYGSTTPHSPGAL